MMKCSYLFIFFNLLFVIHATVAQNSDGNETTVILDADVPMLRLPQGHLVGQVDTDFLGGSFYSFYGIPYAKPPVGDLRFKAPEPLEKWNGTLNATIVAPMCVQKIYHKFLGQEDCLFLNVYTKELNPNGLVDNLTNVLVWLHGGFWVEGSGNPHQHGAGYMITENVVIVTLNYRLGSLGFLSFSDPQLNMSGNAGLKDQLLALKWVEKNIIYFGGDKNRVTLAGNDAGAASVEYLMVSPKARGLFNRVILQSGNSDAYWAKGKPHGIALAKLLEVTSKELSEREAFEIIKKYNAFDILQAQALIVPEIEAEGSIGPVIEPINSPSAIVTRSPQKVIESKMFNSLPYLTGFNSGEGILSLFYYKLNPGSLPQTAADFEQFLPDELNLIKGSEKSLRLAAKIKEFYFGSAKLSMENINITYRIHTDVAFVYPVYREARLLSNSMPRPVYMYRFDQNTTLNRFKMQYDLFRTVGAAHYDELGYIFTSDSSPPLKRGSDEEFYVKRMVRLWGNFIRLGNPNGVHKEDNFWNATWLPVAEHAFNYMNIQNELVPGIEPEREVMLFWDQLYVDALVEDSIVLTETPEGDDLGGVIESDDSGAMFVAPSFTVLFISIYFLFSKWLYL